VIARWKGIIEKIHFGGSIMPLAIIENLDLEKPSFRPSKWPRKLKPAKNSKLPKLPESCFEPVGKGGWPPISTWIKLIPTTPPKFKEQRKQEATTQLQEIEQQVSTTTDLFDKVAQLWSILKEDQQIQKWDKEEERINTVIQELK
jgi:hypothetical protein